MENFPEDSTGKIAKHFNLSNRSYVVTIKREYLNGWIPEDDEAWLKFVTDFNTARESEDSSVANKENK